ncbi:cobaltochelatase subunit CobN [Bacteroidales bacterium OttesenSCG-928-B11]|nr:cobaltochelatase subunit CobN [Bacteroidales bacterium OttesenSCG-928-C03]MDL2311454.1 cobaltochelatase subunit CobN [Bacteroidales bacterium OttesenSCG-928-B11]
MKKRTLLIIIVSIIAVAVVTFVVWRKTAAPTKIALLNFQNFQVAKMIRSADPCIKAKQLTLGDFNKLKNYDAILIFGMGIRMTDEHRAQLEELAAKGVPIYSTAVTDPVNNIVSLDSLHLQPIAEYLGNGGKSNYKSLFNYIRKEILGKTIRTGEVLPPVVRSSDFLFYLDEELSFENVADYQSYYEKNGYYKKDAPKVAIITGIADPFDSDKGYVDSLIISLENKNMNVYPISSVMKRLTFLQEIQPDAVVYFPHGRLAMGQADAAVEWLKANNILLFTPLTLNATYDDWIKDPQGMSGGFMSQSVVMPELDGGITASALVAQYIDDDGLYIFKTIPGRLEQFTSTVDNYLSLRKKANKDKKVAIYYFKGAGNSALTASGLEVVPSLYNFVKTLKSEGYTVNNLPANVKDFEQMIMNQGAIFGSYAEGNINRFINSGYPELVDAEQYDGWLRKTLTPAKYAELIAKHGESPGYYYTTVKEQQEHIAVTRIDLGNITLLPQPTQGTGENSFAAVHGDNPVPPHHYLASYLWVKNGFQADAMIHFGTHGSLEFIPGKQVALSSDDWSDRIINDLPHFYYYTISNVGEGIIAKRRSYATLISHLNPPFMESGLRKEITGLQQKITNFLSNDKYPENENLAIKSLAIERGLHRDLQLDSAKNSPYTIAEIEKINNYLEELSAEKIMGGIYTLGEKFDDGKIRSSVELMSIDPIAHALAILDLHNNKIDERKMEDKVYFSKHYTSKAKTIVQQRLANPSDDISMIFRGVGLTDEVLAQAEDIQQRMQPPGRRMMAMMMAEQQEDTGKEKPKKRSGHPSWIPKSGEMPESVKKDLEKKETATAKTEMPKRDAPTVSKEERDFAQAVQALKQTIENINHYDKALRESPQTELNQLIHALNGGYIAPSSGGDFIANPATLPTGRNLYSINAEATPTQQAWDKGVKLAQDLIEDYKKNHDDQYPRKVSVTLWSGSFIESEGATLAQLFYLLGTEPVRDQFGRVLDIKLIPDEILQRPRIDVVVQTSGQFRDLAASRLALLQKAIDLAAEADGSQDNFVAEGKLAAEKVLLNKGYSPKEARELATTRIFGGINGMAGTGITGMVESGSRWENESEIAKVYLNNMGATYGNTESWGSFKEGVFEAALQNTDMVVQPRQSNTWGALSLDHVYEFMGGVTLTVRNVTGKDPDNYFNDLRNRYSANIQTLSSAIGSESRTTILNPNYIRELLKGGASTASNLTDVVKNVYGWNVMKPKAIDHELWEGIYDVYIEDKHNLNVHDFFKNESPAALQEMTAVMLETVRKGYWQASKQQVEQLSNLHAELVAEFDAGCNGFTCDNPKLKDFIKENVTSQQAEKYEEKIDDALKASVSDQQSQRLKKEPVSGQKENGIGGARSAIIVFIVLSLVIFVIYFVKKRKNSGVKY